MDFRARYEDASAALNNACSMPVDIYIDNILPSEIWTTLGTIKTIKNNEKQRKNQQIQ
jgi:hypothetical protein